MSKFLKALKPLPSIVIKRRVKSDNGINKEVEFHYSSEDEYIQEDSHGLGCGIEMECAEEFPVSRFMEIISLLSENEVMTESTKFSRFQMGKKNFAVPLNTGPHQTRNMILECLRVAVYPNLSTAIVAEPHFDKTVNNDLGGIEIVLAPFSLKAMPLFKVEIARILWWRKLFGFKYGCPDASTHLNTSIELWGSTPVDQKINITRFWNFIWFARDFVLEISNRKGLGEDYANALWCIGDAQGNLSKEMQDIQFMNMKNRAFNMLEEQGAVPNTAFLHAAGSGDTRLKGMFNSTVKGNNNVVEYRMVGVPDGTLKICDEDWYVAQNQYMYACIEMAKTPWNIGLTRKMCYDKALSIFLTTVYEKRHTVYSELWNLILEMKAAAPTIKKLKMDTTPIPIEPLDIEKILAFDYSMFETPVKAEESVFSMPEESRVEATPIEVPNQDLFPEVVYNFECCDCDCKGGLEFFNLEIERRMNDCDETIEEAIENSDGTPRWCNSCFEENNEVEDEPETFTCDECGDSFDEEQKNLYKGKKVCDSCYDDLT
jgi:hypothetical protein